ISESCVAYLLLVRSSLPVACYRRNPQPEVDDPVSVVFMMYSPRTPLLRLQAKPRIVRKASVFSPDDGSNARWHHPKGVSHHPLTWHHRRARDAGRRSTGRPEG